ncbi:AfsA-related hotdog domain-containing protein [Aurantivibrio plasticivorans]
MKSSIAITSKVFDCAGRHPGVYNIDDLLSDVEAGAFDPSNEQIKFVFGQVFSDEEKQKLKALLSLSSHNNKYLATMLEPVAGGVVHKRRSDNSLITPILKVGDKYMCDLVVPKGNDMVADHVTGEHISGMVLIEAARQMSMAVIDSRFDDGRKRYQIINELTADFTTFVHPFETRMVMHFDEFRAKGDKCYIDCTVGLWQADSLRTSVRMTGMCFLQSFAQKMESKSMTKILRDLGVGKSIADVGNLISDKEVEEEL